MSLPLPARLARCRHVGPGALKVRRLPTNRLTTMDKRLPALAVAFGGMNLVPVIVFFPGSVCPTRLIAAAEVAP